MFATITHIPSLHKILSNTPRNHPAPPTTTCSVDVDVDVDVAVIKGIDMVLQSCL
jgi:hypothetical protein